MSPYKASIFEKKLIICSDKIHQGGGVAAPVASQILGEVLPYLELIQDNTEEIEQVENVAVPDVRNMSIKEAKSLIKENGLEIQLNINEEEQIDEKEVTITEQTPKPGIMVRSGSKVYCDI